MTDPTQPRTRAVLTGLLFLALAALVTPRVVGYNLTPDGHLAGANKILLIRVCQGIAVLLGLWCLLRGRPPLVAPRALPALNVLLVVFVAAAVWGQLLARRIIDPDAELRAEIAEMVESEEVLLQLTPDLKKLARSAKNLELPDHASRHLFEDRLTVLDLADGAPESHAAEGFSIPLDESHWALAPAAVETSREEFAFWAPLLADVAYFEFAKFYFHHGDFGNDERDIWIGDTRFAGTARLADGSVAAFHAKANSTWVKTGETDEDGKDVWRIGRWETREAHRESVADKLFREVTAEVLEPADFAAAQRSIHEELVLEFLKEKDPVPPYEDFQLPSFDRHPGVSVVDIDGDGLDDLYVVARHGRNQLFRNLGDRRFEEVAARYGLDLEGSSSAAMFGDFDNDGDPDLFLGRTRDRTRYLVNEGGRFVDRSEEAVDVPLPYMTSSIALADVDSDGLLDVYVSTYGAEAFHNDLANMESVESGRLLAKFLSDEDAQELWRLAHDQGRHKFLKRPGPPNLLLRNLGDGRFERFDGGTDVYLFRNTYHSSFGDFDNDGDQDLYCANDFSENHLFVNDGAGNFSDETATFGVADIGFGMGSDWGDFDNDGRLDLYVANMYSKAGQRITKQVPGLNPRFASMARGNSLFHNREDGFERVSALAPPGLLVEAGGWSWGPQFVDFDNDGWLDLYALSGFYTVPAAVAIPLDL